MKWTGKHITADAFIYSGSLYTAIVLLWPVFMVLSAAEGTIHEQLGSIVAAPATYVVNFIIASLIAPAMSYVMILLAFGLPAHPRTRTLTITGAAFLIPYILLVSISYVSQYTILQFHLLSNDFAQATRWYFENASSLPYFLNQTGYAFFAVSAFLIGAKLIREKGIQRVTGIMLWLSGALSAAAYSGYLAGNYLLNALTILSGILTLPVGIFVIVLGLKIKRQ